MSPKSYPLPCPDLVQKGTFYFCGCYDTRPEQCVNHGYDSRMCPVGVEKLQLHDLEQLRQRIDNGWHFIKQMNQEKQ